jgi:hypothetical protein
VQSRYGEGEWTFLEKAAFDGYTAGLARVFATIDI